MQVYYAIRDLGGGDGQKCRSMQKCLGYFIDDLFLPCGQPLTNLARTKTIDLNPGDACFFLGGRNSLSQELDKQKAVEIRTTDEQSLSIEMRMNLRVKRKLGRLVSSVKGLGLALKDEDDPDRILNEYTRNELTLIVVYHSDKNGQRLALTDDEGQEKLKFSVIGHSTKLGDVQSFLLQRWVEKSV